MYANRPAVDSDLVKREPIYRSARVSARLLNTQSHGFALAGGDDSQAPNFTRRDSDGWNPLVVNRNVAAKPAPLARAEKLGDWISMRDENGDRGSKH